MAADHLDETEGANGRASTEGLNDTAIRILDVAQVLVQSKGYKGFSYRDVAEAVGIRAATIHYYFPSKSDLAAALISRYRKRLAKQREAFARAASSPRHKLELYTSLFRALLLDHDQLCLGAMMSTESASLPSEVGRQIAQFFDDNVTWLAEVMESGRRSGDFAFIGDAATQAGLFLAALEGAMLLARAAKDISILNNIAEVMISRLQR